MALFQGHKFFKDTILPQFASFSEANYLNSILNLSFNINKLNYEQHSREHKFALFGQIVFK